MLDTQILRLPVEAIAPNPYQPRRTFDQEGLAELARSIEAAGVFQPIIVRRPDPNLNRYELIAGERRLRATKMTERKTIPAIVRVLDDQTMMEVAVLENLQREDLSPLEEAQAYQTLIERYPGPGGGPLRQEPPLHRELLALVRLARRG